LRTGELPPSRARESLVGSVCGGARPAEDVASAACRSTFRLMQRHIPKLLERARALMKLSGGPPDELAKSELATAARLVEKLHEGLVGDRALAKPQTYRGELLGAYLLWWWPQTYVKVQAALRMAVLPLTRAPRILDVGSGPGPAAIAAVDLLGGEATCFDLSEEALAEARALGVRETVREMPAKEFDLTLAANVL